MKAPNYQKEEALDRQRQLLLLKKQRLEGLISLIDNNLKGEHSMSFREFDTTEIDHAKEKYAQEVRERWGNTDAYKQSQEKTSHYSNQDWEKIKKQYDQILKAFSVRVGQDPASEPVQKLVEEWQRHITTNYYDCTNEILAGLGQMYVADERFQHNMDCYQPGTAQLISAAIAHYCCVNECRNKNHKG